MTALVAVVYDLGAASPMDIANAAEGLCDIVFVVDLHDRHAAQVLTVLEEYAPVVDLAAGDDQALAALTGVTAITTFSESMMRTTAQLAARLGLRYHPETVAAVLTDKSLQRELLNRAGVTPTGQAQARDAGGFTQALELVGLPAVIKPRQGHGGTDTLCCATREQYDEAVSSLLAAGSGGSWVIEELLPAGSHPGGAWLGDYVSVETAVVDDDVWHFGVTEKLPLAPPFRETGDLVPDGLPDDLRAEVCAVAEAALRAVGITFGLVHTELKLSPQGPRVIEVNGRLGGNVGRLMRRASDLDPVRLALELIVSGRVTRRPVTFRHTSLDYGVMPPQHPVTVVSASPAGFRSLDGVWAVDRSARVGHRLDWRRGSWERVFTVWMDAPHREAVPDALRALATTAADAVQFERAES